MRFDVITLFPELIKNSFEHGITGRALSSKKILLDTVNPRDFSEDINNKVDDRPYGGGPGMVMQAEPMIAAIRKAKKQSKNPHTIFMSPQGKIFNQNKAEQFSNMEHLVIVCGRYEGIDQRFIESEVDVIIVVAGMEGALASIVSSIADVPVIGVPTSIGYGYGEKGVAALASMLQSCSLGLTVVNIDNGVGAGAAAANIANRIKTKSRC